MLVRFYRVDITRYCVNPPGKVWKLYAVPVTTEGRPFDGSMFDAWYCVADCEDDPSGEYAYRVDMYADTGTNWESVPKKHSTQHDYSEEYASQLRDGFEPDQAYRYVMERAIDWARGNSAGI